MKKFILIILPLLFMMGATGNSAPNSVPYLHCEGSQIVDENEKPILLRGFGLGGWLVPEGYMLQTSAQSPTQIYRAIERLIGAEETKTFYRRYEENFVTEADIRVMASWGVNSIRLPFNGNAFWDTQRNEFRAEGFQQIDQLISWCKKYGLYLILDMHCAPGGQNHQNISDSDGEARLWTEAKKYQPRTLEIWRQIAARYAHEPQIAGYDVLNEPVLPSIYSNKHLRKLYIEITKAIRGEDPNHILFFEGNYWARDFRELLPVWDDNMAFSFHKYWDENTLKSIESYLNLRESAQVPLWMGEAGENSNHWFSECIVLLEAHNIGWSWWAPKKILNVTNPFSAKIPGSYQRLLDYWSGRDLKPTMEEAREGLFAMAHSLRLENCQYFPDVVQAVIHPREASRPYVQRQAPVTIHSVDYDLGLDGIAYHDRYSELTTGLQNYRRWNEGYQYRNDGVDIGFIIQDHECSYFVGWTEAGEWLQYTLDFPKTTNSDYDLSVTVANVIHGGTFSVIVDDETLVEHMKIPRGKAGVWQRIALGRFHIAPGTRHIKLIVEKGGFNFKNIVIE